MKDGIKALLGVGTVLGIALVIGVAAAKSETPQSPGPKPPPPTPGPPIPPTIPLPVVPPGFPAIPGMPPILPAIPGMPPIVPPGLPKPPSPGLTPRTVDTTAVTLSVPGTGGPIFRLEPTDLAPVANPEPIPSGTVVHVIGTDFPATALAPTGWSHVIVPGKAIKSQVDVQGFIPTMMLEGTWAPVGAVIVPRN